MNSSKESFDYSNYMTIEALEDGVTVSFPNNCEYGIDGKSWEVYYNGQVKIINAGQTISFKGNLVPNPNYGIGSFSITNKFNLKGNCMSLLFGDEASSNTSLVGYVSAFHSLFKNCFGLISVSSDFLPATELERGCYNGLFSFCTSLTTAPELPATTLVNDCYAFLFYHCSKLNYIKALFTTYPGMSYTDRWVTGVASSGTFLKNKNANWDWTGEYGVPEGWTVINDGEESGGNLITFTIDGTEYQAEERMTWGEWVDSEYNVINASIYTLSNGVEHIMVGVQQGVPIILFDGNGDHVITTQEITINHSYRGIGGGGN